MRIIYNRYAHVPVFCTKISFTLVLPIMNNNFQTLFNTLKPLTPKKELSSGVLLRIHQYEQRVARIKFALLSTSSFISSIALIPTVSYAISGFASSGFYEYFLLLYSDGMSVLLYWKEFALTLAEAVPIFEISLVLAVTYALLESLKFAIKNMPMAFYKYN